MTISLLAKKATSFYWMEDKRLNETLLDLEEMCYWKVQT